MVKNVFWCIREHGRSNTSNSALPMWFCMGPCFQLLLRVLGSLMPVMRASWGVWFWPARQWRGSFVIPSLSCVAAEGPGSAHFLTSNSMFVQCSVSCLRQKKGVLTGLGQSSLAGHRLQLPVFCLCGEWSGWARLDLGDGMGAQAPKLCPL